MGFVTSIFPRRMVQAAGSAVDGPALLRSIGLDPDGPLDVSQPVADDAYYTMLETIAATMPDAHELPLRVGPLMRPNDYGALGLAWKAAPTVRQSLERVERFCRLWTDNMTYELGADPKGAFFELHREGPRRLGMRLSNEATVASATSLIRQTASPRFRPLAVQFRHLGPETVAAHERHFGCPVQFGAKRDGLVISDEALALPNQLADEGISRFLIAHLESEVAEIPDQLGLEELVRRAISKALSEGAPRMAEIGRRVGMSERTLQRRLAECDLSFKQLVESTRRRLAENLLRDARYSLAEVGFLTGFSEQSAFNRAFKRWTGRTPSAFRDSAGDE